MRKVLLTLALCIGMVACSGGKSRDVSENKQTKRDAVEVLYFHSAQRCATCVAIESNSKELLETAFSEQLKSGKLIFQSIDITSEEALADKYEVSWSSLIVVDYDENGEEAVENLTEFAFGNARNAPDKFKAGLSKQIAEMLNN